MLLTKIAMLILKTFVIHGDYLTKNLAFDLFHKIIDCIAINEMSFLSIVSMKVKIKREPIFIIEMIS